MSSVTRVLQTVKINAMRRHPLSLKIYGQDEESLAEDIKANGLQTPPTLTPDYMTIDGHRRIAGCKAAGLTEIQCVIRHDLKDPLEVERAVILANRYREKSTSQKAAEAAELMRIEKRLAELRQKKSRFGSTVSVPVPSPENTEENEHSGKTSQVVGEAIGWSEKTVEAAVEVQAAIEEADPETASELKTTLDEEGVKPALRKVRAARAAANGEEVGVKDKLGNRVPGCLEVTFSDGDRQFTAAILSLGKVRENLSTLRQQPWGIRLVQQLERKIDSVADTLRTERPYCRCPWCLGNGRITVDNSECNRCLGTGWVTKPIYDQLDDANRAMIPGASA